MRRFGIILFFVLTQQMIWGQYCPDDTPIWPQNYAHDVFNRLVNCNGNMYGTKPTLIIIKSDIQVATTCGNGKIVIGSRLVELCRSFGKDSCNAIAHILSHELAHYYEHHDWLSNFTSSFASIEWSKNLSELDKQLLPAKETQADEMGFFYSYNAGYQSWKVSTAVLDSVYKWFKLSDAQMPGYPPLEQRKQISLTAKSKVSALMPLFNIASYFMLLGKYYPGETQYVFYESAGYCLDHMAHENVRTPAVLNNLGVIYFLKAQPYFYEPLNKLLYPLIIDDNASSLDMSEIVGTKGVTPTTQTLAQEAIDLLEKARDMFNQSLKTNKNYLPANFNICLVNFVLREEGTMADRLKLLETIAPNANDFKTIFYQLEAFSYYWKGDKKKMNAALSKAMKFNDASSIINYNVLNNIESDAGSLHHPLKWPVDTFEKIFNVRVIEYFKSYTSAKESRIDPYHEKFILWTDTKPDGIIYTFRSNFSQTVFRDVMFYEINSSGFKTSRGLMLGMSANDVKGIYGEPYFKNIAAISDQYLYPSQNMIITVNHTTQKITGIMYYGIKK